MPFSGARDHLPVIISNLPSISPVVAKLTAIAANPDSSADDMAKVLKIDPSLTGKVLRLANSAYVGIPRSISSLKNAVVLLGQKRIRALAITSNLFDTVRNPAALPFVLSDFWRHSITVALIAESTAKYLRRHGTIDSDEAFTAGLLHDIGKLVLGCYAPERLRTARALSRDGGMPFFKAEQPASSHTAVASLLSNYWKFPADLNDALTNHHAPSPDALQVALVNCADVMAHAIVFSVFTGETPPDPDPAAISTLNVPPERLRVIADEAAHNEKAVESFIEFLA
jgi:putative nucleotidyltransferase with HDIG domain